jgi:hypothetical protein
MQQWCECERGQRKHKGGGSRENNGGRECKHQLEESTVREKRECDFERAAQSREETVCGRGGMIGRQQ